MPILSIQPLSAEDEPIIAEMRGATLPGKGVILGPEARPFFNAARSATPLPVGVRIEPDRIGGVSGLWCRPPEPETGRLLLFLHGGGYMMGSASAMTGFAGQLAVRARAETFVPDYRLAPEHPFPAAIDDALAAYRGLAATGDERLAVAGESAGGGLAMALLALVRSDPALPPPVAAAVMSPWVDLTLSGASYQSRADADPIFTRAALSALAETYLQGQAADDPRASPLWEDLTGLPPIRIDVGDDEVLLDDALRLAERLRAAGVQVSGSVWAGMPHVFQARIAQLAGSKTAMDGVGAFLREQFG